MLMQNRWLPKLAPWLAVAIGSVFVSVAIAKLPAPVLTDEQKAKAEEAKAKAAEVAKKAAADEGRYQDRVAERWFKEAKAAGKNPVPSQWVPPPPAAAVVPAAATPPAVSVKPAAAAAPPKKG